MVDFTVSQNVVRLSVPRTICRKDVLASLILLVSRGSRTVSCLDKSADENPIIRQMPQVEPCIIIHGSCQDWCIQIVLVYFYQGQGALPVANLGEDDVLCILRHQSASPRNSILLHCL